MCSARALPDDPNLWRTEYTGGEGNLALTLDICDILDVLSSSSISQHIANIPQVSTNTLQNYIEDLLDSFYFQGGKKRQAQVGYNVNSFGLRFGKRAAKLEYQNSVKLLFGNKHQFSIPLNVLRHVFCTK
ncbi:hypothetical protein XELAEV_18036098mg [Xenopus laevis]|uniref:Uncharacterized protein n=1 Tax=Xenopus laevis TaxID=8355 RepID=A0A974CH04_XENLA|nr:hypothetical protein XELAEV_18036098mg [Xenopus laevis]